tara:strand:- start:1901 stop:2386 length:486 start_codon:yes stop_codon:yes gene_type:complete
MKISKKIEPMVAGMWVALIIGSLSLLTYETSTGIWLMISFGPSAFIAIVLFKSEIAQPSNIIFGHLICIIIGILFNEIFGVSFLTLGLAVGVSVTLMMYLKSVHPPAAANPLIALLSDVSFEYILFPVIVGSLLIIILSIIINRYVLHRKYPTKFFNLKSK